MEGKNRDESFSLTVNNLYNKYSSQRIQTERLLQSLYFSMTQSEVGVETWFETAMPLNLQVINKFFLSIFFFYKKRLYLSPDKQCHLAMPRSEIDVFKNST